MAKRRYTEEIVTVLRQVEVASANGKPTPQATLSCTFSHPTYGSSETPTFRASISSLAAAILAICCVVLFTRQPVSGLIRQENSHRLD